MKRRAARLKRKVEWRTPPWRRRSQPADEFQRVDIAPANAEGIECPVCDAERQLDAGEDLQPTIYDKARYCPRHDPGNKP